MSAHFTEFRELTAELDQEIEQAMDARVADEPPLVLDDQASRLREMVGAVAFTMDGAAEAAKATKLRAAESEPRPPGACSAKVLCIASGKGGVGKTNTAVNLAIALSDRGLRVTLLDADLGTANADVLCGLTPTGRLDHVITPLASHDAGFRRIEDIVTEAPGGFSLVPGSAGISRMADLSEGEQVQLIESLGELERRTDVLIIDTAAGVGRLVTSLIAASHLCLVVTTPEPTAIADAYALIKCVVMQASQEGGAASRAPVPMALVVNQAADPVEACSAHGRVATVCERFLGVQVPMAGWIAQDLRVGEAVRARKPFLLRSPRCEASRNIQNIADDLAQQLGLTGKRGVPNNRPGFSAMLARLVRLGRA